ncbi:MAG: protein translocase subunit SecD, partial [Acidobacteria bacterium]|nr:protein translocase subunit SecD [Acidobacteriota bacterium]
MTKNLRIKAVVILALVLICVYGMIGIPKSKTELIDNWNRNVKLGLDLKGGSDLVLQVQVQDAFIAEAQNVTERLKEELAKENITFAAAEIVEPKTLDDADKVQINVRGVPGEKAGTFRGIVSDRFPNWVLTAVNSTDYRLNVRPTEALELRRATVDRTMRTIETRINSLGLAESTVQPRGRSDAEAELRVLLPGVDDPARIKQLIQTAAVLELYEVKDGPFATEEEARAKHGGVLPLNTKLIRGRGRSESTGWLLVNRVPVVRGTDLRDAKAQTGEMGAWEANFVLTQDAGRRFERFTEANVGNRLAIVLDNQWWSAPTIQARIGDTGRITGLAGQQEAMDLAL